MRFACLIKKVYKHTLKIFNTYCFSTATTVSLTHLNVKFYPRCVSSGKLSRDLNQLLKLTADPIPSTQLHVRENRIQSYEYHSIYFVYLLIVSQNPYTAVHPMDIGTVKV